MDEIIKNISDSVLSSVKKCIGILEEDNSFDVDIMIHINAAFSTLYQLGVVKTPVTIISKENTYMDIFPDTSEDVINQVKMYLVYKTKYGFDSATSSSMVMDSLTKMIDEAEWRLMVSFNPENKFEKKVR